jgi:thymidylate kinase
MHAVESPTARAAASADHPPRADALDHRGVLRRLGEAGIRHCVLRGGEDPWSDKDLDVLVDPAAQPECEALLRASGFTLLPTRSPFKRVALSYRGGRTVCLDLHWRAVQHGLVYMDEQTTLDRSIRVGGVHRLAPEEQLVHLVFHNLLRSGPLREASVAEIRRLLERPLDRAVIAGHLRSRRLLAAFDRACAALQPMDDETALASARAALGREARRSSFGNVRRWLTLRLTSRFRLRRTGGLIALVGPDGAGKSTVVAALHERVKALPGVTLQRTYLGPWGQMQTPLVPWLRRLGIRPALDEDVPRGGGLGGFVRRIRASVEGVCFYLVTLCELYYRYMRQVFWQTRRGSWVVADRYVTDLRYLYKSDPITRYARTRALVCRLFPQPDLFVMLHNRPEVIVARKDQLSVEEVRRFTELYRLAIEDAPHVVISTDRPPHAIADEILSHVLQLAGSR